MRTITIPVLLLFASSARCFSFATFSPHAAPAGRRLVASPIASDVGAEFDALLSQMVDESAEEREQRMERTVSEWPTETLQQNADQLSESIQARVVAVQTAAIAEHDRGADTTAAQVELQALVDMMVYSKILIRARMNGS